MNPASDESLHDEGRQVEGRERRSVQLGWVKPASHISKYQVSGVRCQVQSFAVELINMESSASTIMLSTTALRSLIIG